MKPGKLILTITAFTENYEIVRFLADDYIIQLGSILNYTVLKSTCGKHVDASRPHHHIMVCYDVSGAKVFKTLNEKIHRSFTLIQYPSEDIGKEFNTLEKKYSFIYEGEQKKLKGKVRLYDESAMCYPFKEYKQNSEIPYELQKGYEYKEIQEMRKVANVSWCEILRQRAQQQALDIEKKENEKSMTEYLKEKMISKTGDANSLVKYIIHEIWRYKKEQYKKGTINSVRVGAIRDQAISFLVFEDYITIEETDDIDR